MLLGWRVTFLRTQLGDADQLAGWQFVTVEIYERGFSHSTSVYEERICTFAIPAKFLVKVPNVFMTDSGQYKSQMGIRAAGWVLKALGTISNLDRDESEELWLTCMTSSPVLLAQPISCLLETPNVATYYTGRAGLFPDFIEQVTANVQDMDAVYIINWQEWFP